MWQRAAFRRSEFSIARKREKDWTEWEEIMDRNRKDAHVFYENRYRGNGEFPDVRFYVNKNFSYFAHWHPETEIVRVTQGKMLAGLNQRSRIMRQGDICILKSGDIHYYESMDPESEVQIALIRPELIKQTFSRHGREWEASSRFLTKEEICARGPGEVYRLLDRLEKEWNEQREWYREMSRTYAVQLLVEISRCYRPPFGDGKETTGRTPEAVQFLRDVLTYIEDHVEEELTVKTLGQIFHMDADYLGKRIGQATGMHFKTYLNLIRIYRAQEKLLATDETVLQIAYECGFQSVRNFNRVFKAVRGRTPTEIRTEVRTERNKA